MPTFNRERAKTELGWSDAQIDAYLKSDQAKQDSASVAPPSGGSDRMGSLAGAASAAVDAIGGPRTIVGGGLLAGAAGVGRHLLRNRGASQPPTPAAPSPAGGNQLPAGLVRLTPEDIQTIPRFKNAKPGEVVRRVLYESARYSNAPAPAGPFNLSRPVSAPASATAAAPQPLEIVPRAKPKPAPKPRAPKPKPKPAEPRKPITVAGKPATRGASQRGASGRILEQRAAALAALRAQPAPPAAPVADDLMEQLAQSTRAAGAMRGQVGSMSNMPEGVTPSMFRGIKSGAIRNIPGALGLLMQLFDAGSIPGQMDEAQQFGQEQFLPPELLEQMRRQPPPRGY